MQYFFFNGSSKLEIISTFDNDIFWNDFRKNYLHDTPGLARREYEMEGREKEW